MEKYSDKEIIDGLRNRDERIVSFLYRRYKPMIRSMVKSYNGDVDNFMDVFQEGLYALLLKVQDPAFQIKHTFKSYFYATCFYQLNMGLRKKDAEKNYFRLKLNDDFDDDIFDRFENETIQQVFREVFDKFGKSCKTLLKLLWREMSLKEVSDILSISYSLARKKRIDCESEMISRIRTHPSTCCILGKRNVPVEN